MLALPKCSICTVCSLVKHFNFFFEVIKKLLFFPCTGGNSGAVDRQVYVTLHYIGYTHLQGTGYISWSSVGFVALLKGTSAINVGHGSTTSLTIRPMTAPMCLLMNSTGHHEILSNMY